MLDPAPWAAPIAGNLGLTSPWRLFLERVVRWFGDLFERAEALEAINASRANSIKSGAANVAAAIPIPAAGFARVLVGCPGAKAGDFALASYNKLPADISIGAGTTGADTVAVWFQNNRDVTAILPAGTIRVRTEAT